MSDELRLAVLSAGLHVDALAVLVQSTQSAYDTSLTMDADLCEMDRVCAEAHASVLTARAVATTLTSAGSQRGADALHKSEERLADAERRMASLQERSIYRRLALLESRRRKHRFAADNVRRLRRAIRDVLPPVEVSRPTSITFPEMTGPARGAFGSALRSWVLSVQGELSIACRTVEQASSGEAQPVTPKAPQVFAAFEASKAIYAGCSSPLSPLPWAAQVQRELRSQYRMSQHYHRLLEAWGSPPRPKAAPHAILKSSCHVELAEVPLLPPAQHTVTPRYTYQSTGELKQVAALRQEVALLRGILGLCPQRAPSVCSPQEQAQRLRFVDACERGGRTWPAVTIDQ